MNAATSAALLAPAPGIYTMCAAEYHADPAPQPSLSNSIITTLLRDTPRHAWMAHPRLNPQHRDDDGAAVFDIGTATHALLLEGMNCAAVLDFDDWRTKDAKVARDAARAAGKIPLLAKQFAAVDAMVSAAHAYVATTGFSDVFGRGKPEQTLLWKERGLWCRARPDWLTDDFRLILDYKSTGAKGPHEWVNRQLMAHGYDNQAIWYTRGLSALGHPGARFVFLVQESFAPFMCYLVEPSTVMVEYAKGRVERAVSIWRECMRANNWPGYSTQVHQADPPMWAMKEEEVYA